MTRCTIQAKISLLLESLQNHNAEDALFPHICRIKVSISIIIVIVIIITIFIIIIINIIMIMIINDNDVQSASDLLCVTPAWLQHVCKSHVCLLSGIYCPIIILIILILLIITRYYPVIILIILILLGSSITILFLICI